MLKTRSDHEKFVVIGKILRSIFPMVTMIFACYLANNECLSGTFKTEQAVKKDEAAQSKDRKESKKENSPDLRKKILSDLMRSGAKIEQNDKGEITGVSLNPRDTSYTALNIVKYFPRLEKIEIPNSIGIRESHLAKIAKIERLKELSLLSASRMTQAGFQELKKLKNLEKLSFTGYRKRDVSGIAALSKLKSLDLSNTYIDEENLEKLLALKHLKELKLDNCGILKTLKPETLAKFSHLESLTFTNNVWFKDRHVAKLSEFQKLRHLDLWGTGITDETLKSLNSLSALKSLVISGTQITDEGISHLASLKNLEKLTIYRTKMTDKAMVSIGKLVKLNSLELRSCTNITDEGMKNLEKLKNLEEIVLTLTPITDPTLERISRLPKVKILKLGFSRNITDKGLIPLGKMKNLKVLSLESMRISNTGILHLSKLTELRELNLNNCSRVSDHGLAGLKNMKKLENLELRSTKVVMLPHIDKLLEMKSLNLYNTRLADAGLKPIQKMKRLQKLDIRQTRITLAGLTQTKSKLSTTYIQASQISVASRRTRNSRSSRYGFVTVIVNRQLNNEEKTELFEQLKKLADRTTLSTHYVADVAEGTMFYLSPVSDPLSFKKKLKANVKSVTIEEIKDDDDALKRKIVIDWKR